MLQIGQNEWDQTHTMSLISKGEGISNALYSFQSAHILSTFILCEIAHTICSNVKPYIKNRIIFHTLLLPSKSRVNGKCQPDQFEIVSYSMYYLCRWQFCDFKTYKTCKWA